MKITVNGEHMEFSDGLTVSALMDELGILEERVAVELNLNILPKRAFAETVLMDGDRIEVVSFVGGGES